MYLTWGESLWPLRPHLDLLACSWDICTSAGRCLTAPSSRRGQPSNETGGLEWSDCVNILLPGLQLTMLPQVWPEQGSWRGSQASHRPWQCCPTMWLSSWRTSLHHSWQPMGWWRYQAGEGQNSGQQTYKWLIIPPLQHPWVGTCHLGTPCHRLSGRPCCKCLPQNAGRSVLVCPCLHSGRIWWGDTALKLCKWKVYNVSVGPTRFPRSQNSNL